MDLKMGNRAKVAGVIVGEVVLHLLGRAIIALDVCYFFLLLSKILFSFNI